MDVMPKWAEVILVPLISLLLAAVLSALVHGFSELGLRREQV